MTQKSLDNVTLKFVNHAKRVIDSRVTKRDQPIALSTSKRQFKEIANDFSLYSRRNDRYAAHVQASLAGSISFRTTAWKMLVASPSCSWSFCRREKLTYENSDASRFVKFPASPSPSPVDNARILFPRYLSFHLFLFFLDINIINIRIKTDTQTGRKARLYGGVLGFKMIGVKLG